MNFTEAEAIALLEAAERRTHRADYDTVTLCPYCGNAPKGRMCCGEVHFEEHYCIDRGRGDFTLIDPATGEETDDMELSRVKA